MAEAKIDPRVIRTRKLIMDSFIKLSESKEFKDITVKDITAEAMINRATFYHHFEDIYDLLEKALSEVLLVNLDSGAYQNGELDDEAFIGIFEAVTNFQKSISHRCHSGYEETIARIIRDQLEVIFFKLLSKENPTEQPQALSLTAAMLSWGIYGASVEWRRFGQLSPEEFIKGALPYIRFGLQSGMKEQKSV